ncbi:hypothetical protein CVT24_000791 [Panaeolus cyanescens]|uniref:Uncharacterized protein n=1 Tax=Panaeolus cyanescens TaxID=181874 RepID=A0A409YCM6_9AGAR|nr:hypothetical protein CVT24_000791 [Panaeolus cyanescens]
MAHNSGFYPVQGQTVPAFQQPQNIYQQLGKPQPQPHLQAYNSQAQQQPGYGYPQPAQKSQQYSQQPVGQQYPVSQTPYQSPQTPYAPSQTPYIPPQTPYAQPQSGYIPPQPQYPGYAPQPSPQPSYGPPQHQQPSPQMYQAPVQPPLQPVQSQSQHVPTSSYALPHLKTPAPGPTGSNWRPTSSTSRPPPISPSAVLAQQVRTTPQAQHSQAQIKPVIPSSPSRIQPPSQPPFQQQQQQQPPQQIRQPVQPIQTIQPIQQRPQQSPTRQAPPSQVPPTPTSSGRRPLPQPAPGMVTKPPVIPAGNVMQRIQALNKSQSVDLGKPFPNPTSTQPQSSTSSGPVTRTPSPTKGRPLPGTPGNNPGKRMTVDMGKLPSGLPSSSFSSISTPTSAVSPSAMSRESSQTRTERGSSSPIKLVSGLPMPPSMTPSNTSSTPVGMSKTSSYAINAGQSTANSSTSVFPATPTSPSKRRASPPRFQSQPNSASGSPTKESSAWDIPTSSSKPNTGSESNNYSNPTSSSFSEGPNSVSGFSTASTSSRITSSTMSTSSTTSSETPRKFTPIWKRTIQEVPAPVWGYAAGMVADPHPKPKPAASVAQPVVADKKKTREEKKKEKELEKDRKKLEKLNKKLGIVAPPAAAPAAQSGVKPSMYGQTPQPIAQSYSSPAYSPQKAPPPQHAYQLPPLSFQSGPSQSHQSYTPQRTSQSAYTYSGHQAPYQEEEEDDSEEEEEDSDEEEEEEETGNDDEDAETEETEETEEEDPRYAHRSQREQIRRTQSQPNDYGYEYERSTPIKGHKTSASEFSQRTPTRHPPAPAKQVLHPKTKRGKEPEYLEERSPRNAGLKPSPQRKLIKLRPKNRDSVNDSPSPRQAAKARSSREEVVVPKKKQIRSRSAFGERDTDRRVEKEVYKRPGSAFARRKRYEEEEEDDYSTEHRLAYDESEDEDDDWDATPRRKPGPSGVQGSSIVRRAREWDDERDARDRGGKKLTTPKEHRRQASSPQYGIRDLPPATSHRRGGSVPGTPGRRYEEEEEEPEEPRWSRQRKPEAEDRQQRGNTGLPRPPAMREGGTQQARPAAVRRTTAPLKGGSDYDEDYSQSRAQPPPPQRHSMASQNFPQGVTAMTAKFSNVAINSDSRSESRGSATTDMSGTTAYSYSADSWPNNLPRLPRTPGSANTPTGPDPGNDYFSSRTGTMQSTSAFNGGGRQPGEQQQQQRPVQHSGAPMPHRSGKNNPRHALNLDDPPPQASVIRTPSPGPSGYTFKENPQMARQQQHIPSQQFAAQQQPAVEQRPRPLPQHAFNGPNRPATAAEQLQRRRSLYNGSQPDMRPRPQSQIYDSPHSQQGHSRPPEEYRTSPQNTSAFTENFSMQLPQGFNAHLRKQPQTPAPPPTIGIESPHPIGGRDKKPDIPMLEESSNDGSDTEDRRSRHDNSTPTIHVNGDSGGYSIPTINIGDEHEPPRRLQGDAVPMINITPIINVESGDSNVPTINVNTPSINVEEHQPSQYQNRSGGNNNNTRTPQVQVYEIPGVSVAGPEFDDHPRGSNMNRGHPPSTQHTHTQARSGKGGLLCAGCNGPIVGRTLHQDVTLAKQQSLRSSLLALTTLLSGKERTTRNTSIARNAEIRSCHYRVGCQAPQMERWP